MPVADHGFDTISSRTVYRGKILALRANEVRMPGGGNAIREVVEHYGAVAVAAVDDGERAPWYPECPMCACWWAL